MLKHFLKLKENLELSPSFDQIVQVRHSAVRSALENKAAAIRDTKLIGSLQRKTRIQPRQGEQFDRHPCSTGRVRELANARRSKWDIPAASTRLSVWVSS